MPSPALKQVRPTLNAAAAVLAALLLAGCAKDRPPGYYATEQDSTLSDAQYQAQGRSRERAPSQIQLGFGDTAKPEKATQSTKPELATKAAIAGKTRPLLEAKTFLGTVPCLTNELKCSATRLTITLAPSGEWRSRTVALDTAPGSQGTTTDQGCWDVVGTQPWRILLQTKSKNTMASLTFVNDNVLRINTINDVQPTLDYHLTRQPDVDSIKELSNPAALQCAS